MKIKFKKTETYKNFEKELDEAPNRRLILLHNGRNGFKELFVYL